MIHHLVQLDVRPVLMLLKQLLLIFPSKQKGQLVNHHLLLLDVQPTVLLLMHFRLKLEKEQVLNHHLVQLKVRPVPMLPLRFRLLLSSQLREQEVHLPDPRR